MPDTGEAPASRKSSMAMSDELRRNTAAKGKVKGKTNENERKAKFSEKKERSGGGPANELRKSETRIPTGETRGS